jgi:hypothetical protein
MTRYRKVVPLPPPWVDELAREHNIDPESIRAIRTAWPDQTITFEHGGDETTVDLPESHRLPEPDIGEWEPYE